MIETVLNRGVEGRPFQSNAGGDEIGVEIRVCGSENKIRQVGAGGGLPAGEMDLQNPHLSGLIEDLKPVIGREF